MDAYLKNVNNTEFYTIPGQVIFNDEMTSRKYGLLTNNKLNFKFSWQSDLVTPQVIKISNDTYGIGIDQHFAILDFKLNHIALNKELIYPFLVAEIFHKDIMVCTEMEIVKVDGNSFIVKGIIALPDIFEDIEFVNDRLVITCAGNIQIELL
jgi:hypothetical protein